MNGIDYCSLCVHANRYLSVKARDSHSLRTGRHTTHEVFGETPVRPLTSIWNTWSPLTCMFGQVWTYFLRERPGIVLYLTLACRNSYSNVGKIYFQGNKVLALYSTIEVMWRHMRLTCRFAYSVVSRDCRSATALAWFLDGILYTSTPILRFLSE